MPAERSFILSVVRLLPTGALLTLTQARRSQAGSPGSAARARLKVWSGVCPASNLCFGFFNFSPIWGGQVGRCLLHDLGDRCQKGICTVDRSKYVYEQATMTTVWCRPGRHWGELLLFISRMFFDAKQRDGGI